MAVTKEQLVISVEVKSSNFDDWSKSAEKNFDKISDSSDKAQNSVSEFSKYFASVAASIESSSQSLQKISGQFSSVSQSIKSTAASTTNLEQMAVQTEKTSYVVNVLKGAFTALAVAGSAIKLYQYGKQFEVFRQYVVPVVSDIEKLRKTFLKADHELSRKISPSFFRYGEVLWELSTPLGLIGMLLTQTDSAFMSLAGSTMVAASGAGIFYGIIISQGVAAISNLAVAIGSNLLDAMGEFEQKFQKSEVVMSQFTFTIKGFQRSLGEDVVGSMEKWIALLDEMRDTTVFASTDIAKSIKLLVAEGTRFGLNQEQVANLVRRTGDVASAFGENIDDVAGKINAAFAGNAQSLMQMGFAVSDSSASHSELYLSMGKTMDQMSKSEKAAVRYDLIMQETAALAGSAANQTLTVAGANSILERSYTDLQVKLGASGGIYTALIGLQARFIQGLSSLPDFVLDTVGALQEWVGISFVVSGVLLGNFVKITHLAMAYKFLSAALATNATLQATLTGISTTLGDVLGVQTVAVTSLGAAYKNIVLIIQSMLAQTISTLVLSLKALAAGFWNAAVVVGAWLKAMAPLAIKIAAIVALVTSFFVALKEFSQEVSYIREGLEDISKAFSVFGESAKSQAGVFSYLSDLIKGLFRWFVNLSKLLIGSVATSVLVVSRLFVELARAARFVANGFSESEEDTRAYNLQIQEMNKRLKETADYTLAAGAKVDIFGASTALAKESTEQLAKSVTKNNEALEKLVNINLNEFDKSSERIRALGDEYDAAAQSLADATKKLEAAKSSTLDIDDKAKAIAEATIETFKQQLAVEKLRQQTLEKIGEQKTQLDTEALRSSGRLVEATRLENKEKLKAFDEQVAGLRKLGKLTEDQEKAIDAARKSLGISNEAKVNQAALDSAKESIKALEEVEKKAEDLQKQSLLAGKSEFEQITIRLKVELDELDALEKKLKLQGAFNEKAKQSLEIARDSVKSRAAAEQSASLEKTFSDMQKRSEERDRTMAQGRMTDYERYKADIADRLKQVEDERAQLEKDRKLPALGEKANSQQQQILKRLEDDRTAAAKGPAGAPSETFMQAKDAGDVIARSMSEALTGPGLGAITGAMNGAMAVVSVAQGAIDAAQQLVDAGPKLLNSFANLINSITELPLKLSEGIANVFKSAINLVANLIPNLIQAASNILDTVRDFVTRLPQEFAKMIDKVDEMLTKLIDDFPEIIENIIEKFAEAIPQIFSKAIEFLLTRWPQIFNRMMVMLYTELPPAIWHGIIEGMKEFGRVWQRWMKGDFSGGMKLEVDTEAAKKKISQLTQDTSRLFQVSAIEQGAKNASDILKQIDQAAKKAGETLWEWFLRALKKGWSWFMEAGQKIWDGLVKAVGDIVETFGKWGKAIWDGLVNAIGDIVETLGAWGKAVWDGLVKAIGDIVKTFGEWGKAIWDGFILPIAGAFGEFGTAIWNGFLRPIGEAFGNFGTSIWTGLTRAIGDLAKTFGDWGSKIWSGLVAAVGDVTKAFGKWGDAIWQGFLKPVGSTFSGFGSQIVDGLKKALGSVGDIFSGLGDKIWQGLKAGISTVSNVLSRMFQFDGGGMGTVESFIGMDFPFVAFAKGGRVPGTASIPGDSPLNDTVPAMLSPGEVVLPRSVMGDEAFRRVVMAKLAGQDIPHLAGGGVIGKAIGGALGGIVGTIIPGWVKDLHASLSQYVGGLDLIEFAKDPRGAIESALRGSIGAFAPNFKQMVKPFATGGLVMGPLGTDAVPARLTAGEFVLNKSAVGSIGLGNLISLNQGKASGQTVQNITVNLSLQAKEKIDENYVRQRLMPAIREELKRGSLDGRAVVYAGGVRS